MGTGDDDISVVLVNQDDEVIGYGKKLDVHRKGLLHRAFSIFVFNEQGELLIQRRAASKYHSPDLWANTCCGHPFPGEAMETAVSRRLFEELRLKCPLSPLTHIYYKLELDNGMIEHEYVHAFKGQYNNTPIRLDPNEISDHQWISLETLKHNLACHPQQYAGWFIHYIEKYSDCIFNTALNENVA